jgi:hypothetical protein
LDSALLGLTVLTTLIVDVRKSLYSPSPLLHLPSGLPPIATAEDANGAAKFSFPALEMVRLLAADNNEDRTL